MRQLNYAGIFWTLLSVKWGMACVAFIGAFLFLWINIRQAAGNSFALAEYDTAKKAGSHEKTRVIEIRGVTISRRAVMRTMALTAAAVAAIFAFGFYTQWDTYLRFRYGGSCGFSDPFFGVDVGFYLFSLPFYQLLQFSLVFLTVLAIVGVVSPYAYFGLMRLKGGRHTATWGMPFRIFPCSFSSWPLSLDGVITWIGLAFCTPQGAWSLELDIPMRM